MVKDFLSKLIVYDVHAGSYERQWLNHSTWTSGNSRWEGDGVASGLFYNVRSLWKRGWLFYERKWIDSVMEVDLRVSEKPWNGEENLESDRNITERRQPKLTERFKAYWLTEQNQRLPEPVHGWIAQCQVYFCLCGKTSLCAKLIGMKIKCHLYIYSHENQVIFVWSILQKHSFCKQQLRGGSKVSYVPSGSSDQRLFLFLLHEVTRSISTTYMYWMGCQSIAGLPRNIKFASNNFYTYM